MLLFGGKILAQFLIDQYLSFEKIVMIAMAEAETNVIEPNLPVTVS